jgi:phosphoribosylformylglycinamidine (FGAM) synthase-like enzyme
MNVREARTLCTIWDTPVRVKTILKWTLVEQGQTPAEADAVLQQVDLALGAAAATASIALATKRRWLPALGLAAGAAIAVASAREKIH